MKTTLFLDVTGILLPDYTALQATDSNINGSHHLMGSQGYSVRSKADKCSSLQYNSWCKSSLQVQELTYT